ncbi:MAG: hypothetical protein RL398_3483 [Planctomycetota bacterium]
MNEFAKTGAITGGAVLLAVVASLMGPKAVTPDRYNDEGQEFFSALKDADAVVDLEVTEFRESTTDVGKFKVMRNDKGVWTIPSHGNYPADAKDRMGKAAALFLGLTKERVVGDEPGRHVEFGVVDPLAEGADTAGRGKRVTMKDSAGNVLADLILGKEVEGKMDTYYVRVPDKKRVYAVKLGGEVSTKFADWIETDLLKAQSWDIAKVTFDNYSVDEQKGEVVPGDKYVLTKDAAGKWNFDGIDSTKEEANEEKMREIGETLGQIKIVGVRSKPEGITASLETASGFDRQILMQMLIQKGFFPARGGKLYSNEGDLLFETKKGVRYTLRFGELVPGEGDEVTSGAASPKGQDPKSGETGPQPVAANNRYLMVAAEFDENLLDKPKGLRLPQEQLDKRREAKAEIQKIVAAVDAYRAKNEQKLPESLQKLTEKPAEGEALLAELKADPWGGAYALEAQGEGFAIVSWGADKAAGGEADGADVRSDRFSLEDEFAAAAGEWSAYDTKVEEGRKEADKLTKRFGPWYYVIDQALFDKLKPKRADLVKQKSAEAPVTAPATGNGDK